MAEAGSRLTVCSICQNTISEPRILPCMDSFCLSCLRSLFADSSPGDLVQCPACAEPFTIPDLGLESLKKNSFLVQLSLARNSSASDTMSCDICSGELGNGTTEARNNAVLYCSDCRQYLCELCSGYHSKMTVTKCHSLVSTVSEQKGNRVMKQGCNTCSKHRDELLILFCRDCNDSVCLKCNFEKHKPHRCDYMDAVAVEFRGQIREKLETLTTCLDESIVERQDLETDLANVRNQIDEAELWVTCKKEEIKRCIDNDAKELMSKLGEYRNYLSQEYDIAGKRVKDGHDRVACLVELSSNILSEGSDMALSSTAQDICRRADELLKRHRAHHANHIRRPAVEVSLRSLGLEHLTASRTSKHKINLIGKISALVIARESVEEVGSTSQLRSSCYASNLTDCSEQKLDCRKRVYEKRMSPNDRGPCLWSLKARTHQLGCSGVEASDVCTESSDEETTPRNSETFRVFVDSTKDSSDINERILFSCRRARLYFNMEGEWIVIGSGKLILSMVNCGGQLRLEQKLTNELRFKQRVTTDMEMHSRPDFEGRELTWINMSEQDVGTYGGEAYMFSVRFKSKPDADRFKWTFESIRRVVLGANIGTGRSEPVLGTTDRTVKEETKLAAFLVSNLQSHHFQG